ncbi:MAG: ATP phosphoribosyltransferase regulatory subunit [Methylothermaceae bacteria B42]|nr:MAG: ATP phosphoribosyltransferase regulatory subunit [Methylothermaceae bacteria B42]HHJ38611.1 ATP phosphoribosyltransferase regulatory subunit [Methylothermaceae bacterium]
MAIHHLPVERWLLPDGIEELLPSEAQRIELLRRRLLDAFASWGYEQVIPPLIEFLDSLLIGAGHDLEMQTFKLSDPASGRLLGLRADMTPQVARIDAHNLKREGPTRLCYAGPVLHAYGDALDTSRSPMQIGAELYGCSDIEADLEVIRLMLETLAQAGVLNVHLDLGHVGIYRSLAGQAGLDCQDEESLFAILQRKSKPDLVEFLQDYDCPSAIKEMLVALVDLNGSFEVLTQARKTLAHASDTVSHAIAMLETTALNLRNRLPSLPVHFDLAELRGYHYHTGLVFAALVPGFGKEIARGGRYDAIGKAFGRARPAVGFSTDLKLLLRYSSALEMPESKRVLAPPIDDPDLLDKVHQLRQQGWQVIQALPNCEADNIDCHYQLVPGENGWEVVSK